MCRDSTEAFARSTWLGHISHETAPRLKSILMNDTVALMSCGHDVLRIDILEQSSYKLVKCAYRGLLIRRSPFVKAKNLAQRRAYVQTMQSRRVFLDGTLTSGLVQ